MLATKQLLSQLSLKPATPQLAAKAFICHKSKLPEKKVRQWPYEKYQWYYHTMLADPFTKRKLGENSKIIQVEGNIACGKYDFATRLAKELDMKFIDVPDIDCYYVNDHGYDYCALNPYLPERLRHCNKEMFHENPARHSVIHMQYFMFKLRVYQYIKALQHVLNTGQGVVLARSAFTHRVFIESMHELGWLPMGYLRGDGFRFYDWRLFYINLRNYVLGQLLTPHLTIYLETPVETCMKRIKASRDPLIASSNALIPEYLEGIEKAYNDIVLPRQEHNGHLLRVPYPKRISDVELMDVIDDIEELDFAYDHHDTKFGFWNDECYDFYIYRRMLYTSRKVDKIMSHFEVPDFDIAGLGDSTDQIDLKLRESLYQANVTQLGLDRSIDSDPRFTSYFRIMFPNQSNEKMIYNMFRADFV